MNQWTIMLFGMGTVFIALIVIDLILKTFPYLFGKGGEPRTEVQPKSPADRPTGGVPLPAITSRTVVADKSHDPELVAVIAAAVAAATGMGQKDFRIVNIEAAQSGSSGFTTPVWGRINRTGRGGAASRRGWQR